ncbi:MAG: type II toxin-antitoxin system HicB family antitoxin [Bacteroidales bacterium]|nr:type II toxin-antitoxin system HicB family antitoxin [Bacteroidales bacterium]
MAMKYTATIVKTPEGVYVGQCEQVPEAITEGYTIDETLSNLREAIELVLDCKRQLTVQQIKAKKKYHRVVMV